MPNNNFTWKSLICCPYGRVLWQCVRCCQSESSLMVMAALAFVCMKAYRKWRCSVIGHLGMGARYCCSTVYHYNQYVVYSRSSAVTHLTAESLCPFTNVFPFPHLSSSSWHHDSTFCDSDSFFFQRFHVWASLVAQMVKNLPVLRETWVRFLGWEDCLEEGMATDSSILAWRIPMDRGIWWATVHGVAKSQIRLSD